MADRFLRKPRQPSTANRFRRPTEVGGRHRNVAEPPANEVHASERNRRKNRSETGPTPTRPRSLKLPGVRPGRLSQSGAERA